MEGLQVIHRTVEDLNETYFIHKEENLDIFIDRATGDNLISHRGAAELCNIHSSVLFLTLDEENHFNCPIHRIHSNQLTVTMLSEKCLYNLLLHFNSHIVEGVDAETRLGSYLYRIAGYTGEIEITPLEETPKKKAQRKFSIQQGTKVCQLTFRMTAGLRDRLKDAKFQTGRNETDLMTDALSEWLAKNNY